MTIEREKIFAFLDTSIGVGAGNVFENFESRDSLMDLAVEEVELDGTLTKGCGVGPLMGDIDDWVDAFAGGRRHAEEPDELALRIQFSPAALGYKLFRSQEKFGERYPKPLIAPAQFPVFVKEMTGDASVALLRTVLSYLYLDDVTIVA